MIDWENYLVATVNKATNQTKITQMNVQLVVVLLPHKIMIRKPRFAMLFTGTKLTKEPPKYQPLLCIREVKVIFLLNL